MSTTNLRAATRRTRTVLGLIVGLAGITSLWLFFRDKLPGNMATGMLCGGLAVLVIFGLASWRAGRNPAGVSSIERSIASEGDERDATVLQKSMAVVGMVALPLTSAAAVALALEAQVSIVMALLLWAELLIGILAYAVINKRT